MFSNINEAWNHDPIKEITDKISQDRFRTKSSQNNESISANRSDIILPDLNNTDNDYVGTVSLGDSYDPYDPYDTYDSHESQSYDPSETTSLRILSNTPHGTSKYKHYPNRIQSRHENNRSYRPRNYRRRISRTDLFRKKDKLKTSPYYSYCSHCLEHFDSCYLCNDKIQNLIDSKVSQKLDNLILENKIKHMQSQSSNQTSDQSQVNTNSTSTIERFTIESAWKDIIIIALIIVVMFLIIFVIIKVVNR